MARQVSVSERQRLDLYERLGETLGREHAEVLMEYLPPVGWGDVARRHDVDALRLETQAGLASSGGEIAGARGEMTSGFAEVRGEIAELRGEMHAGFTASRAEIDVLRGELEAGFAASRAEIDVVRGELKAGFAEVRGEMQAGLAGLRQELHEQLGRFLMWIVGTIFASVAMVLALIASVS